MNRAVAEYPSVNGVAEQGSLVLPNVNSLRKETVTESEVLQIFNWKDLLSGIEINVKNSTSFQYF